VDEVARKQLIAQVATDAADLLANTRRERDRRRSTGEDTAWLDTVLRELEPLVEQTHDLDVVQAIHAAIDRHSSGPYPADELATIAGVAADARCVLKQMAAEGLATRQDQ
jgi:hypothetical protein